MNAFVLNVRNCNFKVTLVKIESIKQASVFVSLSFDVKCMRKGRREGENGRFYFHDGGMFKDGRLRHF